MFLVETSLCLYVLTELRVVLDARVHENMSESKQLGVQVKYLLFLVIYIFDG